MGVMVPCEKILERAKLEKADLIGLSGLITPSLDEMAHVAREMERQGFKLPLLIGGATTSRAHTAVKIAPHYSEPVVHVLDASRAVPVTTSLLSDEGKPAFVAQHRADYEKLRQLHAGPRHKLVPLEAARANRTPIEWRAEDIARPEFTGVRVLDDFPARDAARIHRLDAVLSHLGAARRLPADPRAREVRRAWRARSSPRRTLSSTRSSRRSCCERAAYTGSSRPTPWATTSSSTRTRRARRCSNASTSCASKAPRSKGEPNRSLGDFIAPKETGLHDHIGGVRRDRRGSASRSCATRFRAKHDDYNAIMAEALADRLAEAFAECLHKRVREEWGYGRGEELTHQRASSTRSTAASGRRRGTPRVRTTRRRARCGSCSTSSATTGMRITESFAMWPGSSVSGLYFAHPEVPVLHARQDRPRPGGRLREPVRE